MAYARIAARHFGTEHHEYYVTPDDLVAQHSRRSPRIYDQPFGNSSALPAYYCAQLARDATASTRLLAGDGGDELFGGNTRYAKQRVFDCVRRAARRRCARRCIEPLLLRTPAAARVPLLRKGASYVEQARVPMPDRLQMYNLLRAPGAGRGARRRTSSRGIDARRAARGSNARSTAHAARRRTLNRMLAYDWQYTLADNDLPKVRGAAALAGIDVGFPAARRRAASTSRCACRRATS